MYVAYSILFRFVRTFHFFQPLSTLPPCLPSWKCRHDLRALTSCLREWGQPPTPTGIRHLFGEHPQDLLAQLNQPQTYPEEHSSLPLFPCEQAVGSYPRFFGMLRLTPRPQEAPRPITENVRYTLGTMSRTVARLCATKNENRVALVNLVDEMET